MISISNLPKITIREKSLPSPGPAATDYTREESPHGKWKTSQVSTSGISIRHQSDKLPDPNPSLLRRSIDDPPLARFIPYDTRHITSESPFSPSPSNSSSATNLNITSPDLDAASRQASTNYTASASDASILGSATLGALTSGFATTTSIAVSTSTTATSVVTHEFPSTTTIQVPTGIVTLPPTTAISTPGVPAPQPQPFPPLSLSLASTAASVETTPYLPGLTTSSLSPDPSTSSRCRFGPSGQRGPDRGVESEATFPVIVTVLPLPASSSSSSILSTT